MNKQETHYLFMMTDPRSRIQWDGPSWRLRVYPVRRPDGETEEKGYIDHPGAVVLVPLQGEDILMLRQYRVSVSETILELPAGTRGWEEAWLDCAQRELREETGYRANHFTPLGRVLIAPGYSNEIISFYLATDLTPDPLPADFDERFELQLLPLETAAAMALDGRLRDAKSIVGILRTAAFLKNHSSSS